MATVLWQRPELTGGTFKLFLKPKGSGTVANTGGDDLAEATGLFSGTVSESLTDWHFAEMRESPYALADVVATGWANMSEGSTVHVVETIASTAGSVRTEVERLAGIAPWPIEGDAALFAPDAGDNNFNTWPAGIVWDGSQWCLYYTALTVGGSTCINRRTSADGKTAWSSSATVLSPSGSEANVWSPVT